MTCDAQHPRIEFDAATCPLCEMLDLCHQQQHELDTLRAEKRAAHAACDELEEKVRALLGI